MANVQGGSPNDFDPSLDASVNQAILQTNYNSYLTQGGNPALAQVGPGMLISQGKATNTNPYNPTGGYGGGYGITGYAQYAPYDEGGGHTKWDEFVQQMAYNNAKLAQDKQLQEEQLAQQKLLQEEQIAEQKYASQQQAVTDYDKQLNDMKGPADPYGYLFASRGLAAPMGYSPTALPLSDAVKQSYQDQGIDLAAAQKQVSGASGPSFISGVLGGMPTTLQQGPMGFQNSPQFANVAPGSQPPKPPTTPTQPSGQQPTQMAKGGTVPGYAPGKDTVPAKLSPGEGVLTPDAVRMMGGPAAIKQINDQAVQHFAAGGVVQPQGPLWNQSLTDLGNGMVQRGVETATARDVDPNNPWDTRPGSGWGGTNPAIPIWTNTGNAAAPVGFLPFGTGSAQVNGIAGASGVPVTMANGQAGFMNPGDIQQYTMPYTGNRQSLDPWMPAGFQLFSPGVAINGSQQEAPSTNSAPVGAPNPMGPTSTPGDMSQSGGHWVNQVERYFGSPTGGPKIMPPASPIGSSNSAPSMQAPPPIGSSPQSGGSVPLLTGGQLNPAGPVNGPPMNLNDLDPYTRSMVDMYGRPQIPSMQAWNTMPQSGQQAYQNYVEKVAGGNFQDLLDEQQKMAPQGVNAGNLRFS